LVQTAIRANALKQENGVLVEGRLVAVNHLDVVAEVSLLVRQLPVPLAASG
jgi:hypothetical protein